MSSNKYTFIFHVGTQVSMDDAQTGFIWVVIFLWVVKVRGAATVRCA
jgi:hypothetical protein